MIVAIAIRRRFIGFMLALIVFYGLLSELTIFLLFPALSAFLDFSWTKRGERTQFSAVVVRLDALCATRMKFMASNMRFHTTECFSVPAELHIATLSFISEDGWEGERKLYLCDWGAWYMLILMSFNTRTSINYGENKYHIKMNTNEIPTRSYGWWTLTPSSKFAISF